MRDPFLYPDRSIAFFSHTPKRAEASMLTWTIFALVLVLAVLAVGGPP